MRTQEAPCRIGPAASKGSELANLRLQRKGKGVRGMPNAPSPFALAPRRPSPLPTASLRAAGTGPGPHPPASSPGVVVATARVSTRVDRCARAELEDGDGRYRGGTKRGARASWSLQGARWSVEGSRDRIRASASLLVVFGLTLEGVRSRELRGSAVKIVSRGYRTETVVSSEAGIEDRPR